MGIFAHYLPTDIKNAYLKIQRVWGSKEEGWNAWVGVFKDIESTTHENQFHIGIKYEECNPFPRLYEEIAKLQSLSAVEHHDFDVEQLPTDVPVQKKGRKKKAD